MINKYLSALKNVNPVVLAVFIFAQTIIALLPNTLTLEQHGDEKQYAWSAAYFTGKVFRLDFRPIGSDPFYDPGWSPYSYWTITQPMGTRFLFGLALLVTGAEPPARPYNYGEPHLNRPDTDVPLPTLYVLRLTNILCAAVGFSFLVYKLTWNGLFAVSVLLLIPHVRSDLSMAWAEGPLMLGFGLCILAYRTRWFPIVCGISATFKLTAFVVWVWAFLRGYRDSNNRPIIGFFKSLVVWVLLTPSSWFFLGPPFLFIMAIHRVYEYLHQSMVEPIFPSVHLFLPTRYLWPVELGLLLLLFHKTEFIRFVKELLIKHLHL